MTKDSFLDTQFEAVSTTDGYTWYQSDMVIDLAAESPLLSFHRAQSQTPLSLVAAREYPQTRLAPEGPLAKVGC
jgi:hypothetical protein